MLFDENGTPLTATNEKGERLFIWQCEECGHRCLRTAKRTKDGHSPRSRKCLKCKSEALTVYGF